MQKNIFLQNIYGFTPAQKISSKFNQKWVNASQLKKKTFFCLLTLLTYAGAETKTAQEWWDCKSLSTSLTVFFLHQLDRAPEFHLSIECVFKHTHSFKICCHWCGVLVAIIWPIVETVVVMLWILTAPNPWCSTKTTSAMFIM